MPNVIFGGAFCGWVERYFISNLATDVANLLGKPWSRFFGEGSFTCIFTNLLLFDNLRIAPLFESCPINLNCLCLLCEVYRSCVMVMSSPKKMINQAEKMVSSIFLGGELLGRPISSIQFSLSPEAMIPPPCQSAELLQVSWSISGTLVGASWGRFILPNIPIHPKLPSSFIWPSSVVSNPKTKDSALK